MPEPELEFDDLFHVYRLDGVRIPSCTQILAALGTTPGFSWMSDDDLEFYRSRGHAVHAAVEYSVKGVLDRRTVVDEVKPYFIGWERAVNDLGIEVLTLDGQPFVEIPLCHPTFRYGVKPDVVAYVRAFKKKGPIEVKATSVHCPATGIQLGSQHVAIRRVMPDIDDLRVGLRLLPKEPYYDVHVYTERSDEATWISMLNTYNWLSRHKLLRENKR